MLHECRFVLIFLLLLALTINLVHSAKADVVPGKHIPDHVTAIDFARGYEDAIKPNAKLKDFEILRLLGGGAYGKVHLDNKPKTCAMYLVMQPFRAGDLFTMIMTTGSLMHKEYALRFIAANMVLAIEYLHKRKVAHRDIKIENFLIGDDGYVALSDFGLSVLLKESCTSREQCTNLFDGKTFDELIDNILNQPIVMPAAMPPNLKSFLLSLINRDPLKRLGAKKGAEEIKNHPFFEGTDWSELEKKSIPAPIVPRFDADGKVEKYYDIFTLESFWISPPAYSQQVQQPQQQHNPLNIAGSESFPNPWV
ncbi:protein kinase domain-containing protein [Ditylenchus destructor]|nr:protein kinase domain-containing protein [Ditylenchus destructor]